MPTTLITGANRGIGLEFVRQYTASGWRVFAAARNPDAASELQDLAQQSAGRVQILAIEVTDAHSIASAAAQVGDEPIDLLINCAGAMGGKRQTLGDMDYESWMQTLNVNTLGPMRVTETFIRNVLRSERKLIVTITSGMGSLADNTSGGYIAYRTSKAAVNMVMRTLAVDLAAQGVICILINPGWVKTRMGGAHATTTPQDSVRSMRRVFEHVGPAQSGRFFNHNGHEYPW